MSITHEKPAKTVLTRSIGDGLYIAECPELDGLTAVGMSPEEAEKSLLQMIEDRFAARSSPTGSTMVSPDQDTLGEGTVED